MEAETIPETVVRSDDPVWILCFGSQLTIADLMRIRRTCTGFRDIVHRFLKDNSRRKTARRLRKVELAMGRNLRVGTKRGAAIMHPVASGPHA